MKIATRFRSSLPNLRAGGPTETLIAVAWALTASGLGVGCSSGSPSAVDEPVTVGCSNGIKDGTESDRDCGGKCADAGLRCAVTQSCKADGDCNSSVCAEGVCAAPRNRCTNGIRDAGEGGVDCGGSCAPVLCPSGSPCVSSADCGQGTCLTDKGVCGESTSTATHCANKTRDQGEGDVDCGAVCAPILCASGQSCRDGSDCAGGTSCLATGRCGVIAISTTPDYCSNQLKDHGEGDVDCGAVCSPTLCVDGQSCRDGTDCSSGHCSTVGKCETQVPAPPPCQNQTKDQAEGDVDCGASCAPSLCALGRSCADKADCSSGVCAKGICVEPGCSDGLQDLLETDVDCGGGCAQCDEAKKCLRNNDCKSGSCGESGVCIPHSCSDTLLSPTLGETAVDCGGSCATAENNWKRCATEQPCKTANDCRSFVCPVATGICDAAPVVPAALIIDDFEDSDAKILTQEGRAGGEYIYGDGTATAISVPPTNGVFIPELLHGAKGPNNLGAVRITGSGFAAWGSGFGFEFNSPTDSPNVRGKYDCSAHKGIAFWARTGSGTPVQMQLYFPSLQTSFTEGSLCKRDNIPEAKGNWCDDDFVAANPAMVQSEWKYFKIPFAGAAQRGYDGCAVYPSLDLKLMLGLQFRFDKNTNYDVWLDDLAFYD